MERIPHTPPHILPIFTQEKRPFISVMIPAFNCINYLEKTIRSVLVQDPGVEQMQIEVVDDFSNDADVEELVWKIGKGRVGYFRQKENVGSLRNFETCLNRAKGYWVHLLHGDDMVKPGFYTEVKSLIEKYPNIGSAITGVCAIDKYDNESEPLNDNLLAKPGILPNWLFTIATMQRTQPPSVVVKRDVYEKLGSFFLVEYGEDWEMWIRIAAHYPVAFSPACLAMYRRDHETNISSKGIKSGKNHRDLLKVIEIVQNYLPEEKRRAIKKEALRNFSISFASSSYRIYKNYKETGLSFILAKQAFEMHKNIRTCYWIMRFLSLYLANLSGLKKLTKVEINR